MPGRGSVAAPHLSGLLWQNLRSLETLVAGTPFENGHKIPRLVRHHNITAFGIEQHWTARMRSDRQLRALSGERSRANLIRTLVDVRDVLHQPLAVFGLGGIPSEIQHVTAYLRAKLLLVDFQARHG